MASAESERIPCPSCGKTYRWKPELSGRKVVCKACDTQFAFPEQPKPKVQPPQTDEPTQATGDDGLYDLATDPDEERELPPAFVPSTKPPADEPAPPASTEPVDPTKPSEPVGSTESDEPGQSEEDPFGGEPVTHISEAKKAARREELRLARVAEDSIRTWRDYKLLYIVLGLFLLFVLIYIAMYMFSEAMEDGLHNTMRQGQTDVFVSSNTPAPGD